MAYTYHDFVSAATSAGLLDQFGDDDLRIAQTNPEYGLSALKLTQDLRNATTPEQQLLATEALNQLRKSYGSFGTMSTGGSGAAGGETVYQQALNNAQMPAFSYDPSQDPSYAAAKKSYLREGERAREDTMAAASAMTGGVPSSYAVTAASQAGDYYATKFADTVPTLEQNAYQRYLAEYDMQNQKEQQDLDNAITLYKLLGDRAPDWVKALLGISASGNDGIYVAGSPAQGVNGGGIGDAIANSIRGAVQNAATKASAGVRSGDAGTSVNYDFSNIIDLGYGPVNEEGLADLVASGQVEMYQDGNTVKFKKRESPWKMPDWMTPNGGR